MYQVGQTLPDSPAALTQIIRENWANVYFGAVPYLEAMATLQSVNDSFGCDSCRSIIHYFLGNARQWRGPVAKAVKEHLKKLVDG